jgi:hypothetical protein
VNFMNQEAMNCEDFTIQSKYLPGCRSLPTVCRLTGTQSQISWVSPVQAETFIPVLGTGGRATLRY